MQVCNVLVPIFKNFSKYPKQALLCITTNWIDENGQITGGAYASKFSAGRVEYVFSLVGNDHARDLC